MPAPGEPFDQDRIPAVPPRIDLRASYLAPWGRASGEQQARSPSARFETRAGRCLSPGRGTRTVIESGCTSSLRSDEPVQRLRPIPVERPRRPGARVLHRVLRRYRSLGLHRPKNSPGNGSYIELKLSRGVASLWSVSGSGSLLPGRPHHPGNYRSRQNPICGKTPALR